MQSVPEQSGNASPRGSEISDLANAKRLVELHGQDIRFCPARKKWLIWTGQKWVWDTTGEVERRAKETAISIHREAARISGDKDPARKRALEIWAQASESKERLNAMIKLAQSESSIPVSPEQFDADPMLVNCANGTLDLRTYRLLPHQRSHLITKQSPVAYDPNARCPQWEQFLLRAMNGDMESANFLQRAVGYSISGDTSEEKLFFAHGPGATGKSTFLEACKAILGDYAATSDFEAFLKRGQVGAPRNDIARLAGARMVLSIEVDEGKKLAEALIKTVTGGDTVTARFLYREAFEFVPAMKLWLCANDAPGVRADDDAMWRRILRIPFKVTIPVEERDPRLKAMFKDPNVGGPAILAWAVAGFHAWRQYGLAVPKCISEATDLYRKDMDPIAEFIEDCCLVGPGLVASSADLWSAYLSWAAKYQVENPLNRTQFAKHLKKLGCAAGRSGKGRDRIWIGIQLVVRV